MYAWNTSRIYPSLHACFIEYVWNAANLPSGVCTPNVSRVFGFGVAVNANIATFACLPVCLIFSVTASSISSTSTPRLSAFFTAFRSSPDVEECASSIMTPKLLLFIYPISSAIYGNFWIVVMMIFALLARASLRSADVQPRPSALTNPSQCSRPIIACCSWRSTVLLSVMIMTLSKTATALAPSYTWSDARRYASQEISFVFPEPAECWIR